MSKKIGEIWTKWHSGLISKLAGWNEAFDDATRDDGHFFNPVGRRAPLAKSRRSNECERVSSPQKFVLNMCFFYFLVSYVLLFAIIFIKIDELWYYLLIWINFNTIISCFKRLRFFNVLFCIWTKWHIYALDKTTCYMTCCPSCMSFCPWSLSYFMHFI